jgi:hypothetical protein
VILAPGAEHHPGNHGICTAAGEFMETIDLPMIALMLLPIVIVGTGLAASRWHQTLLAVPLAVACLSLWLRLVRAELSRTICIFAFRRLVFASSAAAL